MVIAFNWHFISFIWLHRVCICTHFHGNCTRLHLYVNLMFLLQCRPTNSASPAHINIIILSSYRGHINASTILNNNDILECFKNIYIYVCTIFEFLSFLLQLSVYN